PLSLLEKEWSMDNEQAFFVLLRERIFSESGFERVLDLLYSIDFSSQTMIDRRWVALLWYMPIFIEQQMEGLVYQGAKKEKLEHARCKIVNRLEEILGLPQ
ncbi:MAG: hypothetical protein AAGB12_14540, partial [Pseudomonadota bacterium]